jgi:hypothetical protein
MIPSILTKPEKLHWLFFIAATLIYLSLSPGTIEGMGYARENLIAADQIVDNLINLFSGRPLTPIEWTRHGCVEPIFELPLVLLSRMLFGSSVKWAGRVTALLPIVVTAWMCALIFVWVRRITNNLTWSYALASVAAFTTMLWPYAYVGLETTQSAFLLYAGYIAIGREPRHTWVETLLFASACAVALSAKLNGPFLLPAVGFLIWSYFRPGPGKESKETRTSWAKLVTVAIIIVAVYAMNQRAKASYWAKGGVGSTEYFFHWLADTPVTMAMHAFSYFGSPNKSILIYAPVIALSIAGLPRAYRAQPRVVIFALLTLAGLVGGFSLVYMWAEETWGPRYLHAAIAPLVIALAASRAAVKFAWRKELPLLASAIVGLAVSFLGSFFAYTPLHIAAINSGQSTLEALQYDLRWNHVRFNLKLLQIWTRARWSPVTEAQPWPPAQHWWFERPSDAPQEKTIDLRGMAAPQSILAQGWRGAQSLPQWSYRILRFVLLTCLAMGLGLFWVLFKMCCDDRF